MIKSETKMRFNCAFAVFIASLLVFSLGFPSHVAFAEPGNDIETELSELQKQIEASAAEYDEASKNLEELEAEIAINSKRIEEIETELPEQEEKSNQAMKALYKMQQEGSSLVDMLLSTTSLSEFLITFDYITHLQNSNIREINRLKNLKEELEETRTSLNTKKASAVEEKNKAEQSLLDAQAARQAAQEAAIAEAQAQAAAAAAAATTETDTGSGGVSGGGPSNIDWSTDKETFVAEWEGRINAYLSGSPLGGQGRTFAEAAWNYGVDPRWSPAISNTESSKGRYCFLPHNAWGWGSVSWGSWEEAINAHVAGLARGYGYTISYAAAQKYCPPNADHWYNATLSEMNRI